MYDIGYSPYRVIEITALSLFHGNSQSRDQKPDFWNSFTKQIQKFLRPGNAKLKEPETKEAKKEQ